MCTILRFTAEKSKLPQLEKIGFDINSIVPGAYTGMRRGGDGFSCDVSTESDRSEHGKEALRFVSAVSEQILQARTTGGHVTLDVSVHANDFKDLYESYHFAPELLQLLAENMVSLEFTIYGVLPNRVEP